MPITYQPPDSMITNEERIYVRNVHAPHAVRRFVRAILEAWGMRNLVDDTETVATELATNAVQNAIGDTLAVRIDRFPDSICVKVWDDNPDPPVEATPAPDSERGRGLLITAVLSERFGCYPVPSGGKVAWATLKVPAA